MIGKTTEKTSLAERAETAIVEQPQKETRIVKKEKKETAVVKKEKGETAIVKKEKVQRAVVKKEKKETAIVKKEVTALERETLSYMDTVNHVRDRLKTADASVISGRTAYQIDVTGQGSGIFYIEIADGFLAVEPYDYHDHDARFVLSSGDLLDILDGNLDIDAALTEGRLYVDGSWDRAMEVKKLIAQL